MGALLLCNVLAACGGGGGGEPSGGIPAPGTTVSLSARGTSAASATLTWQGHEADASARYRIERRKGSTGAFETVAEVAAGDGLYLDRGLAASSSYAYRLVRVDAGGSVLAHGDAHTSDVQPVVTAAGEPIGEAASVSVSQQATVLSAGDGSLTVELPADAQRAAGTATVQRLTNPLPEGRGEAMRIELPSRPNGALVVKMKIPATEDAEAAAQRLAVRTEDGSWLLLPAAALDTPACLVTTTVPAAAFSAAASASRDQASAVATAASAGFRLDLVRLVAMGLRPAEASVRVVGTLRFMPYAVYQVLSPEAEPGCEDAIDLCVPMPVLAKQELPILNNKPLYERV